MTGRKLGAALALLLAAAALLAATAGGVRKPAFPVTLTAGNGKVTIPRRPVRIVSLSPSATETLFAIGAGSQVVAVDDQSNYPARAPHSKLSGFTPNVEAIAGYRPDLVVLSYDTNGVVAGLRRLHVPVLLDAATPDLASAYAQWRQLGRATGHDARAAAVVARVRGHIQSVAGSVPAGAAPLSVYHELSPDYYSATSKTFVGRIYALLRLTNVADAADKTGSGYPQLSGESVIQANPSLIFLADSKCCSVTPAAVAARPGWDQVAAVRSGRVVAVDDDVASRWGPRVADFVDVVARAAAGARG